MILLILYPFSIQSKKNFLRPQTVANRFFISAFLKQWASVFPPQTQLSMCCPCTFLGFGQPNDSSLRNTNYFNRVGVPPQ